ncbi:MAG: J domain-containing protein [Chloroflexota bacterium]|nr:J domain-containing protein [Chloroflexota bacterium]
MNYYEILDVPRSATMEEIRRAYREMVEIHHPDRMQALREEVQERAALRMKLINEAYDVLRNPEARERYDALLVEPEQAAGRATSKVQPGEARSRLQERLETVECSIAEIAQQIAGLRPRQQEMKALDERWGRYLFASLSLAFPFFVLGNWASLAWASAPISLRGLGALGVLLLFGYLALFVVMLVSHIGVRDVKLWRALLSVPLVLLLLVMLIVIAAPRTFWLLLLLGGYGAIIWQSAGRNLATKRDEVSIAMSRMARLEEELYEFQREKQEIEAELARR